MWLEPYKDKYRAFERYIDPYTGKTKRVSTIIDRDTKGARKAAESVLKAKIAEACQQKKDEDLTLHELEELYIKHQIQTTKPQTWHRDQSVVKNIVKAIGPDVLVNKLSARFVSSQIQKTGKENITQNSYIYHFGRMMRWAYKAELVDDISYISRLQMLPDKEKKLRISDKYLDSKELKAVLSHMKVERWKLLTEFLALSGLRIGEAIALEDTDVTDCITISKTVDVKTGELSQNAKTDAGNRDVYIQPELVSVVKHIRLFVKKDLFKHGNSSSLFFPDSDGGYINYYTYNKYLKANTLAAVGRTLTPHALRHTHVSLLAEEGYPLEAISRRVGHESSKITKEIYLHITDKQKEKDKILLKNIRLLK